MMSYVGSVLFDFFFIFWGYSSDIALNLRRDFGLLNSVETVKDYLDINGYMFTGVGK